MNNLLAFVNEHAPTFLYGPIHTILDSSYIGLIPISDRPSIHTIPDESDMLRIALRSQITPL